MRSLLIIIGVGAALAAMALVIVAVRWQERAQQGDLGPSEAQQKRAEERAVQKSAPPQELSATHIRRYQERLDAEGFHTGSEKDTITPQTEAALRAYQAKYGWPVTGELDEATQRSLAAGQTPAPGKPTEGQSVPGGTAPYGSPR
jgi:peptidoglycan hydrolase-like protein with peptidoglycan-binding domain